MHTLSALLAQTAPALEEEPVSLFFILLGSLLTVSLCVLLHYESIRLLIYILSKYNPGLRTALLGSIATFLIIHMLEIMLFALGLNVLGAILPGHLGQLVGSYDGSLADRFYFSAAVYTTVGFGDIVPVGPVRLFVAIEALAGLVLITWSASFTFFVMQYNMSRHQTRVQESPAPHEA